MLDIVGDEVIRISKFLIFLSYGNFSDFLGIFSEISQKYLFFLKFQIFSYPLILQSFQWYSRITAKYVNNPLPRFTVVVS